jgi:hypothetical protein
LFAVSSPASRLLRKHSLNVSPCTVRRTVLEVSSVLRILD